MGTTDLAEAQWTTVARDIFKNPVWRKLTQKPAESQQPFPGLAVLQWYRDGTAKLAVLDSYWDHANQNTDDVQQYIDDIKVLAEDPGEIIIHACKEATRVVYVLNWITVLNLYREVSSKLHTQAISTGADDASSWRIQKTSKHYYVTISARKVFAILQQVMYARGRELLLHPTGYLALRRMNQFSLPDAIFMGASWLFSDQASFHQGLASSGAHTTHANCAEVLKATLLRMCRVRGRDCLQRAQKDLLQDFMDYFAQAPCEICYSAATQDMVQSLVAQLDNYGWGDAFGGSAASAHPTANGLVNPEQNTATAPRPASISTPLQVLETFPAHAFVRNSVDSSGGSSSSATSAPSINPELLSRLDGVILDGIREAADLYINSIRNCSSSMGIDIQRIHNVGHRYISQVLQVAPPQQASSPPVPRAVSSSPQAALQSQAATLDPYLSPRNLRNLGAIQPPTGTLGPNVWARPPGQAAPGHTLRYSSKQLLRMRQHHRVAPLSVVLHHSDLLVQ